MQAYLVRDSPESRGSSCEGERVLSLAAD